MKNNCKRPTEVSSSPKDRISSVIQSNKEAGIKPRSKAEKVADLQKLGPVWKAVTNRNYTIKSVIGEGSYGMVVKAKDGLTKKKVAIKLMEVKSNQYALVKLLREIQIGQFFNNTETRQAGMERYFTSVLDLFCPPAELQQNRIQNIFMVMPLQQSNLLEINGAYELSDLNVKTIMYNLLCSLKYLHSANIVHRDIKPANILVDDSSRVMLCDFGLSRTLPESVVGKHNGQTNKVRHSVLKKLRGSEETTEEEKRNLIMKKLGKVKRLGGEVKR